MTAPLVTIGITVYNAQDTVAQVVRSALAQTWRPIEVVAVDDCSVDASPTILAELATSHTELRVFRTDKNGGVAVARNRILAEAKGEFVAFFDDDDESLPERIETQFRRILDYERDFAQGKPVICHTARRLVYTDGTEQIAPSLGQREGCRAPAGIPIAERILLGTPLKDGYGACPACSQMARTSTYRTLGGFDPAFRRSEDSEFNIRLAKSGGHFVGIAQPLTIQTMTKTSDKSLRDEHHYMLMLLDKHRDIPDRVGLYPFCRRWIESKQAWLEGRKISFALGLASLALRHPAMTVRRLTLAVPNLGLNRAFSRFHRQAEG